MYTCIDDYHTYLLCVSISFWNQQHACARLNLEYLEFQAELESHVDMEYRVVQAMHPLIGY